MLNIIAWIGTFGSIISNLLITKKIKIAPIIWTIATGLLFIVALIKKDWSNVFLFGTYEIINIYMNYEWNKKG